MHRLFYGSKARISAQRIELWIEEVLGEKNVSHDDRAIEIRKATREITLPRIRQGQRERSNATARQPPGELGVW